MMNPSRHDSVKIPLKEKLGSVPGVLGIRLEEEPKYEVIDKYNDIEIRHYEPILLAQAYVAGDHQEAIDRGFQTLAKYIFGDNESHEHIAMTSPVLQQKELGIWVVSFSMPSGYTMDTLPLPMNQEIQFTLLPERLIGVYRYSGNNDESKMTGAQQHLLDALKSSPYTTASDVFWAQYDQPFAVPFLKRNEAQVVLLKI